MSAAMMMTTSSRAEKNRSWPRSSRSVTVARDPAELSGCAAVAAAAADPVPEAAPAAARWAGSEAAVAPGVAALSAGAGQDARAIAGSSARGAAAGSLRSAEAEVAGVLQKSVRSGDVGPPACSGHASSLSADRDSGLLFFSQENSSA